MNSNCLTFPIRFLHSGDRVSPTQRRRCQLFFCVLVLSLLFSNNSKSEIFANVLQFKFSLQPKKMLHLLLEQVFIPPHTYWPLVSQTANATCITGRTEREREGDLNNSSRFTHAPLLLYFFLIVFCVPNLLCGCC